MNTDLMSHEGATMIVKEMRNTFGEKFNKQWAGIERDELIETARRVLAGLTKAEVQRGLVTMYSKTFCPSLPEFRGMCRPANGLDISWDSPDVAWSKALESENEALTIIWTDEASEAFGIAKPALDAKDKFTAGRAFKDHYAKLIDKAKLEQRMPKYWSSLGEDVNHRLTTVEAASSLLALSDKQEKSLVGYIADQNKPLPADVSERLAKIRAELGFNQETQEERYAKQLAEQEEKKARQIEMLKDRLETRHIDPYEDKDEYLENIKNDPTQQLNQRSITNENLHQHSKYRIYGY